MARQQKQLELPTRTWGGRRKGAGRPRIHAREVAHRRRASVSPKVPLHVTVRMAPHVWNLRSDRGFRVVGRALFVINTRADCKLVHYSVQGNHIHMLVEATDRRALSSAMRGLNIRIGRGMNHLMKRSGRVIDHRYHARSLRTPTEVRRALAYVRNNHAKHGTHPSAFVDPRSSEAPSFDHPTPSTWLLRVGWRRGS